MNKQIAPICDIKAIIGLGNPGNQYTYTRHNIGFRIVDLLAEEYGTSWQKKDNYESCNAIINDKKILLIKPMTYMNDSGKVLTHLAKQGIKQENILVIHDELELAFGELKFKFDGSAKGHNGLKSLIALGSSGFLRLRFGIDRPENRAEVPDYVLAKFKETADVLDEKINDAVHLIIEYLLNQE